MDGNDAACTLLAELVAAIEVAQPATVARLPTANVVLAMRYVETSDELGRLEQRAVSCCAYLRDGFAAACSSAQIEVARSCAAEAVQALRTELARAPLTQLAAFLCGY